MSKSIKNKINSAFFQHRDAGEILVIMDAYWKDFGPEEISLAVTKLSTLYKEIRGLKFRELSFITKKDQESLKYKNDIFNKIIEFKDQFYCEDLANIIRALAIFGVDKEETVVKSICKSIMKTEFRDCSGSKSMANMLWAVANIGFLSNERITRFLMDNIIDLRQEFDSFSLVLTLWSMSALCYNSKDSYVKSLIREINARFPFEDFNMMSVTILLWSYAFFGFGPNPFTDILFERIDTNISELQSTESITQVIICQYFFTPDLTKYPNLSKFIKENEHILKQEQEGRESSLLHEGIHTHLINIFKNSDVTLEKEKYLYGFFVDEYFTKDDKKYLIEVNGPVHFQDCRKRIAGEIKNKIFRRYGFDIVNLDFRNSKEMNDWNRNSKAVQKKMIENYLREHKILPELI
jgi:hypothetical protein